MTPDVIIGLVVTGLVGFTVGYLMLNKQRPIFRMYLAMLAIGMGYLYFTGAMEEIGAKFARHTQAVAPAKSEAPAAETKTAPAATAEQPTKTEAAPPAAETKTAPEAAPAATETKPAPATQVDPYPGAPKPAQ